MVVLYLRSPVAGATGRCDVLPTAMPRAVVVSICTVPLPVTSRIISLPAFVVLIVVSVIVRFPIELPPPTPKGPTYLAPTM